MIKAIGQTTDLQNVSQGTINKVCSRFVSDLDLSGQKLIIDVGLWAELNDIGKTNPGWEIYYPFAAGNYALTLNGVTDIKQNLVVEIDVIDEYEFIITVQYVALADTNDGININPIDNLSLFTSKSISLSGLNVYDSTKVLSVKATVVKPGGLDVAVFKHYFKNTAWNLEPDYSLYTDYYTTGVKKVDGWVSGKDLYVNVEALGINVCSEWYGGVIRTSHNNNTNFWDDLRLQYAKLGGTPVAAHTEFEFNKITSSKGFLTSPYSGLAVGQFVIDTSYFVGGEQYQLFFIWKDVEGWHSYLTSAFGEISEGDCPPIFPNSVQTIIYNVDKYDLSEAPNSVDFACINTLSPCQRFGVQLALDVASIDAELVAKGYSNTFNDIYYGLASLSPLYEVKIYATETLELGSPSILDLTVIESVAAGTWTIQGFETIPESWAGSNKYVFIVIKFFLPEGELNIIYPYSIGIANFTEDLIPVNPIPDIICDDETELEICVEGAEDGEPFKVRYKGEDFELGTYDTEFADGQACITIDETLIGVGEDICLCVYSQSIDADNPSDECGCGDLKITAELEVPGEKDYTLTFDWSDIEPDLGDVYSWYIQGTWFNPPIVGERHDVGSGITVNKYTVSGKWCSDNEYHICGEFTLKLKNGCTYTVIFYPEVGVYPGSIDLFTPFSGEYIFNLCGVPEIEGVPCQYDGWLEVTCDEDGATLTVHEEGGNIVSQEYSYDLITWNPYTIPVIWDGNEVIYFKAEIEPSEGTPCLDTYYLFGQANYAECAPCTELAPTSGDACEIVSIEVSYDNITDTLTLTDSIDGSCVLANDTGLNWSFNGVDYFAYTVPIDVIDQWKVYYYRNVECENGCFDSESGIWERECNPCDGGGSGEPGADGADGETGGVPLAFSTTTTDSDPGNGIIRFNNGTIGSVTQLFIDNLDNLGNDITGWLATFDDSTNTNKGHLVIRGSAYGSTVLIVFQITGSVTAAAGYYKIPVSYTSGTLPADLTVLSILFSRSGDVGSTGANGSNGSNGSNGTDGKTGGVPYDFSTTTTDADPGAGRIRYNNGTIASVTKIYIDDVDDAGNNQTAWYALWDDSTTTDKGFLVLQSTAYAGTTVNIFKITAVTAATGYYKIDVVYVSGSLPASGHKLSAHFSRTGDKGDTGAAGASPEWIRQLNDYTLTATTGSQKIFNAATNGTLTLSTGTYFFELLILLYNSPTNFTGHTFSIKGAGTSTIATIGMTNTNASRYGITDSIAMIDDNSVNSGAIVKGTFRVTSAGTIIPSISLTGAVAAVVKAGSFFRVERVGAESDNYSSNWS